MLLVGRERRLENILALLDLALNLGLIRLFLLDVKDVREHAFLGDLVVGLRGQHLLLQVRSLLELVHQIEHHQLGRIELCGGWSRVLGGRIIVVEDLR